GAPAYLQVNLTGIGPTWTVVWADGVTNTSNPGTNVLIRTNFPSNPLPNQTTNYSFWVTQVTDDSTSCTNRSGQITGTNRITVMPELKVVNFSADKTNACSGEVV